MPAPPRLSGPDDFCKQGHGVLIFHTLKNHSFPEYIYTTSSGIMCLDIHQQHSYLVAVGFYDGHVAVYNLKKRGEGDPAYKSTAKMGKHTDPVWEVRRRQQQRWECQYSYRWIVPKEILLYVLFLFRFDGRRMTWTVTTIFVLFHPMAELCPGRSSRSDNIFFDFHISCSDVRTLLCRFYMQFDYFSWAFTQLLLCCFISSEWAHLHRYSQTVRQSFCGQRPGWWRASQHGRCSHSSFAYQLSDHILSVCFLSDWCFCP